MYIEMNNPNDHIRELLCKQFNHFDISDIENVSYIADSFQYMYNFSPDIHECILKVMYQDYFIEKNYVGKRYKLCNNISELYELISSDPFFVIEMLQEVFNFYGKSFLKKKELLSKGNRYQEYLKNMNCFYVFDLFQYCRKLTKEDLLYIYYEEDKEFSDLTEFDREFYVQDKVEDFIYELYNTDIKSYYSLSKQIFEEGYYFLKNKSLFEKLDHIDNKLIFCIENTTLEKLKYLMVEEDHLLSDILYYFIEYNKLPQNEQAMIKIKIKNKFCNLGDISCT